MGIVNKSKLDEIKNICERIRNSELETENQEAKSDTFETLEVGMDAIDKSETKESMFSYFDEEEQTLEEIAENVGESNIRALEEKFKNDTFPSTVIGLVKQYNGHGEMKITEAGREACAKSVVRFSESENNMRIPYPSEEEMDVAMQYLENIREWEEQVEKGTVKKKTLFNRFKSIFRK